MTKTVFVDGTPVTPAFMNAINNPTYSPNPQNNGELPFPPAFGLGLSVPESQFVNSSLRGTSKDTTNSFDFTQPITNNKTAAAGVNLASSPKTDMSGIVLAHAAGDPARGFWVWNAGGAAPTIGKKIEFFLDVDYLTENHIFGRGATAFEPYEVTFQLEVRNNSAEGSTAQIKSFLNVSNEAALVSAANIEMLEDSGDLVLNPGQSGFLWIRFKVLKSLINENYLSTSPSFGFELLSAGNFNINFLGLGVFRANTFGKKVPIPADRGRAELYSMVFREKNNRNIDPVAQALAAEWTAKPNVTIGSTFKAELWPDSTIRVSGKIQYNFAVLTDAILAELVGNPLQLPFIPGSTSAVILGNVKGDGDPEYDLFIQFDAVANKTILRMGTISGLRAIFANYISVNVHYYNA